MSAQSSLPSPRLIRAIRVKAENNGSQDGLFAKVLTRLTTELGLLFEESDLGNRLRTTPDITIRKPYKSLEVVSRSNRGGDRRTAYLRMTDYLKGGLPKTIVQLGYRPTGELCLEEWVSHSQVGASLAVAKALSALQGFVCYDRDNERTGVKLSVGKDRLQALLRFIRSGLFVRSLPLILLNPDSNYSQLNLPALASSLTGWARVAQLPKLNDWEQNISHTCPPGTIRLYSPKYSDLDSSQRHPQWEYGSSSDPGLVFRSILSAVGACVGEIELSHHLANPFERRQPREQERASLVSSRRDFRRRRYRLTPNIQPRPNRLVPRNQPSNYCPHNVHKSILCRICDPKGFDDLYGVG